MNLKELLTSKKEAPEQENFLALEIHESLIKTAVWEIEGEEPSMVSIGSFELWDSEESLINGVDASLTSATKNILKKPKKAILGLPEPWLDGDKIHPTKTSLIKNVLTELGLKPIGLVTSAQAIIHHLKKKEGIPPSAILLEVYPDKVTVAVVKLGKVEAIEEVGRSGELNKDVQEGLTRLNLDQLPPRFVLTNGSNLEEEQQQLLSYPWREKLPFVHLPKVEVLSAEFSIEAIALAGGLEVASSLGAVVNEEVMAPPTKNSLSNLGFHVEKPESRSDSDKPVFKEKPTIQDKPIAKKVQEVIKEPSPSVVSQQSPTREPYLSHFKNIVRSLKTRLVNVKKKSGLVMLSGLLSTPIFLTVAYFTLASAQVMVTVKKTSLSETINISFSGEVSPDSINLPINTQTFTASVSESISTTGEALVGDKASGTVIFYNGTNDSITIKSGAQIESDNLIFLLNTPTTIASQSANKVAGTIELGKSDSLSVTAVGIGTRYNLSKSTEFSVGSYSRSVVYAIAENDFTGGSSRTVKAVSEDDHQKLLEIASNKVISEIDLRVKEQDSSLSSLVIGELSYSKKDFSLEIGEEADVVSLNLTGEVNVLLYSDSEITNQISTQLIPKTNPGMKLLQDQSRIEILPPQIGEDVGVYKTQAKITGSLIPVIDQDRYISQVKGKSVNKLKNILETIPGYESTKIIIKPNIPLLSRYIPLNKKRVSLNVTTTR